MSPASVSPGLIYPPRLSTAERETAARYLAQIPGEQHQAVLDELEGRLRAVDNGGRPVYNELGYLRYYCQQVRAGRFESVQGLKVQGERERRDREAADRRAQAQAREATRRRRQEQAATGERPLARAKRLMAESARAKRDVPKQ